jgi:2-C-methyl-D-erythritol 4-phosphate cytidylyltransferase
VLGLVGGAAGDGVSHLTLHGRSLTAHAREALAAVREIDTFVIGGGRGEPGLDAGDAWRPRAESGLILHDPGCPLLRTDTIVSFLQTLRAADPGTALVGVRPVTDTIKEVIDGTVVGTVDRNALAALAAPIAVGPELLDPLSALLPQVGDLADLGNVVRALVTIGTVITVEVPSSARRVADPQDVTLVECLHALQHRLRER